MRQRLREAWTQIIQPDDYESHMAAVGQAQANAALVADYVCAANAKADSSFLFVGAGTGQMFDFVPPVLFLPYTLTFTDINARYLERLGARLSRIAGLRYETRVDDLENSELLNPFDMVIGVLVLEHVDWRAALYTMCRLAGNKVFVIIQKNPPDVAAAMTVREHIPETMQIFSEVRPALVSPADLDAEFAHHGFAHTYTAHKTVRDDKTMLALGFLRGRLFV